MKITVIMTVKNGEYFIEQSVLSVLNQSYKVYELIILDDGSTDNTVKVIEELIHVSDIPIKLLKTSGVGRAKALNIAARAAEGDWIANLDVDDSWHPDKIHFQVHAANKFPDCNVFITSSEIIYGAKSIGTHENFEDLNIKLLGKKDFYTRNPVNHSSVMIRSSTLKSLDYYNEDLSRQIDIELWIRLLVQDNVFCLVDLPLTVKRLHDNQSFEARGRLRYSYSAIKIGYSKLLLFNAPIKYYPIPTIKFIYNICPRSIRNVIRKIARPNV